MSEAPLIECRGASCGYHAKPVLSGVDLTVSAGEIVALLGPNGSGKSTLLKSILGEIRLLSGSISVSGSLISSLSSAQIAQRVALVPQEEAPAFAFTVREAVTLGRLARSKGLGDSEHDVEIATEAMRRTDCLSLADRPITEISGGERQRVLIARALAQDTPVLLLDEPTSHLDPLHQVQVVELTRSLAAEGRAVVAAVHDLNLAAELADQALLLGSDGVLLSAPIEDVLWSEALEKAYAVRFERTRSESGAVIVRPRR
jgi:iron complex transport system ATP-binding protein